MMKDYSYMDMHKNCLRFVCVCICVFSQRLERGGERERGGGGGSRYRVVVVVVVNNGQLKKANKQTKIHGADNITNHHPSSPAPQKNRAKNKESAHIYEYSATTHTTLSKHTDDTHTKQNRCHDLQERKREE